MRLVRVVEMCCWVTALDFVCAGSCGLRSAFFGIDIHGMEFVNPPTPFGDE